MNADGLYKVEMQVTALEGHMIRNGIVLISLVILLLVVAGCRGDSQEADSMVLGSDNTLSGSGTLVCSQDCLDRAQCGATEQAQSVLMNSSGPATIGHDMVIPAGTSVNIDRQEMHPVIQTSDQSAYRAAFYLVEVPDVGMSWVAGWCVGQQVQ